MGLAAGVMRIVLVEEKGEDFKMLKPIIWERKRERGRVGLDNVLCLLSLDFRPVPAMR